MTARLVRTVAPAQDLVTLDEAKDHARVDHDADNAQIAAMVAAAIARLDGPFGLLSRALVTQTWTLTLDEWPAEIEVPLPPLQSVDSITYTAMDGATATLDPADYSVGGVGDDEPAIIWPVEAWPKLGANREAVSVTFTAGYGAPGAVPEPIRQAALAIVAALFDGRGVAEAGVEHLIAPYRRWVF